MINSVRNTVLSVLNKNNYGYLSPSDFNLFAKQAQLEIYEEYFSGYNDKINQENVRTSGTGYANTRRQIEEVIEGFSSTNFLYNFSGNIFFSPSLTTTGDQYFMINKVLCYPTILDTGTNTSVVANQLVDSTALFTTLGISAGDIVVNTTTNATARVVSVSSNTVIILTANIFTVTPRNYAIIDSSLFKEADKVTLSKISMLLNSNLTSPSTLFPAFTQEGDKLSVYPTSLATTGQVQAQYFRLPKDPKWTYITLASGEPVFDQSQPDYQDFELAYEDEYKLVAKILEYAGMSIRETEVVQFGMTQEQMQQQQ
jgi:hypothetical protein